MADFLLGTEEESVFLRTYGVGRRLCIGLSLNMVVNKNALVKDV